MAKIRTDLSIGVGPLSIGVPLGGEGGGSSEYFDAYNKFQGDQDRLFQQLQFGYAVDQNILNKRREDNRLQRLVADARKAGISPLAALGAGGAYPNTFQIPSYTPVTGRVGGTYQRNAQAIMQIQLGNLLEKQSEETQYQKFATMEQYYRALMAQDEWTDKRYDRALGGRPVDLFVPINDNSEFLRQKYGNDVRYGLNPDLNMEYPESVGGYYWTRENILPNPEGTLNNSPNNWLGVP